MTTYTCSPTGVIEAIQCVNNYTVINGQPLFSIGIVVAVWLILYFRNKDTEGTRNSIVTASFITLLVAIILSFIGILYDFSLGLVIVLCLAGIAPVVNRS